MSQRLRKAGLPIHERVFAGKNLKEMADGLKQLIEAGALEAYDDEENRLRQDLGKLTIQERSYGYRLAAVSDEMGHADVATAMAIAIPRALRMMAIHDRSSGDDILWWNEEASADEIESMPEELKDIYEMGDTDIGFEDKKDRIRRKRRLRRRRPRDDDDDDD
jgi:hypothetical protein